MRRQTDSERERRLLLSRVEAEALEERDLHCPVCGFRIQTLYSDVSGHLRVKCPKCKGVYILNLAYFRTIKRMKTYADSFFRIVERKGTENACRRKTGKGREQVNKED